MNPRRATVLRWTFVLLAVPLVYFLFRFYCLNTPTRPAETPTDDTEAYVAQLEEEIRKLEQTIAREHEARERADRARKTGHTEPEPAPPPPAETANGYRYKLSSGLFSIPVNARSVDWAIINNSDVRQPYRVTVYEAGVKTIKKAASPGSLTMHLEPSQSTHNANSVGYEHPFRPGFYYEVIVETNTRKLLPSVQVWSNHGNAALPGTLIGPGHFVDLADEPSSQHTLPRLK